MPVSTYGRTSARSLSSCAARDARKFTEREGDGPQSDPRELLEFARRPRSGDDWQAMFRNSAQSRRGRTELFNAILERVA